MTQAGCETHDLPNFYLFILRWPYYIILWK